MKKEKAYELLKSFPKMPAELMRSMEILTASWLLCDGKQGYHTICKQRFTFRTKLGHREKTICPHCHHEATLIKSRYNFNGTTLESEDNFAVCLSSEADDNLYISCWNFRTYFHRGELVPQTYYRETQRYIFTDKNALRFGRNKEWEYEVIGKHTYFCCRWRDDWTYRTKLTEPQFDSPSSNRKGYMILRMDAIKDTCMRYSALDQYEGRYPIRYLRFYQRHRSAERLLKCRLGKYVDGSMGGYAYYETSKDYGIDWKENEVHKMLGVPHDAVKPIADGKIDLETYRHLHCEFPKLSTDKILEYHAVIGRRVEELDTILSITQSSPNRIVKYLGKIMRQPGDSTLYDYRDYINMCRSLGYDISDRSVLFPRDFTAAHDRVTEITSMLADPNAEQLIQLRTELEYELGDLMVISPSSSKEIVEEGKALVHCVGGYAKRHIKGSLSIMFLRRKDEPDKPYYTIEVSNDLRIVQCRGYKNNNAGNPKPKEIRDFEEAYQKHLDGIHRKMMRKLKGRKSA